MAFMAAECDKDTCGLPDGYLFAPNVSRPRDIADKTAVDPVSLSGTPTLNPVPTDPEDEIETPDVGDVTEEILAGEGVFDIYMRAGSNQLQSQYDAGRIKGAEYAAAYIQMMELMMTQANMFVVQIFDSQMKAKMFPHQMLEIKYKAALYAYQAEEIQSKTYTNRQQVAELKANGAVERTLKASQIGVQEQQAQLYERQMKGFDDKNRNDAFKTTMDAWAIQSVEIAENPLDQQINQLTGDELGQTVTDLLNDVGFDNAVADPGHN